MKLTDKPWLKVGLLALITVGLFLVLRFYKLLSLPVFVDESIYIRWSQVMRAEPTLRFLPLSDGKQPLFMWLVIPALKLFQDPVFAGRTISVVAGFATLVPVKLCLPSTRPPPLSPTAPILHTHGGGALFFVSFLQTRLFQKLGLKAVSATADAQNVLINFFKLLLRSVKMIDRRP